MKRSEVRSVVTRITQFGEPFALFDLLHDSIMISYHFGCWLRLLDRYWISDHWLVDGLRIVCHYRFLRFCLAVSDPIVILYDG